MSSPSPGSAGRGVSDSRRPGLCPGSQPGPLVELAHVVEADDPEACVAGEDSDLGAVK
jgi:hypothetical protein